MLMHPPELIYSPQHIWLKDEKNGLFRLGLTHHYQAKLGKIVFIELPPASTHILINKPFGSIESSKAASDLISPINATVVELNQTVIDKPGLINNEPYGQGWLLLVKPGKIQELQTLLSAHEYVKSIET
jgi:glycine cleavage system H protein